MSEVNINSTDVTVDSDSKKRKIESTSTEPTKKVLKPTIPVITLEDISTLEDIPHISMIANGIIKTILQRWEYLGKDPTLLLETKKSLFPLLVKLRKHTLEESQLTSLLTILYHIQQNELNKAEESYMKLSIGNVAWPIGVVSVSIHARSRDSKLFGGQANIMIDEKTRRWITGIKRLITFKKATTPKGLIK